MNRGLKAITALGLGYDGLVGDDHLGSADGAGIEVA